MTREGIGNADDLREALLGQGYLADRGLSTGLYLALELGRPILVEGEAGVGKTELALALAGATGAELIRLQCYEGIDASQALYEWDYPRQLLYLRALGDREAAAEADRISAENQRRLNQSQPASSDGPTTENPVSDSPAGEAAESDAEQR